MRNNCNKVKLVLLGYYIISELAHRLTFLGEASVSVLA
jgi:hypothetical protein